MRFALLSLSSLSLSSSPLSALPLYWLNMQRHVRARIGVLGDKTRIVLCMLAMGVSAFPVPETLLLQVPPPQTALASSPFRSPNPSLSCSSLSCTCYWSALPSFPLPASHYHRFPCSRSSFHCNDLRQSVNRLQLRRLERPLDLDVLDVLQVQTVLREGDGVASAFPEAPYACSCLLLRQNWPGMWPLANGWHVKRADLSLSARVSGPAAAGWWRRGTHMHAAAAAAAAAPGRRCCRRRHCSLSPACPVQNKLDSGYDLQYGSQWMAAVRVIFGHATQVRFNTQTLRPLTARRPLTDVPCLWFGRLQLLFLAVFLGGLHYDEEAGGGAQIDKRVNSPFAEVLIAVRSNVSCRWWGDRGEEGSEEMGPGREGTDECREETTADAEWREGCHQCRATSSLTAACPQQVCFLGIGAGCAIVYGTYAQAVSIFPKHYHAYFFVGDLNQILPARPI